MKILLIVCSNLSLIIGLFLSFSSNRLEIKTMGKNIRMGMHGKDAEEESILIQKRENLENSDNKYNWGIFLTVVGIIGNAISSLLP